jgi:hypothetical protein
VFKTFGAVAICGFLFVTAANAGSAPSALYGKSIVLGWSENRVQRSPGLYDDWKSVNAQHSLSFYVSSNGRVFSRQTNTTKLGTGATDEVAGTGGASRVPSFSGSTMTIMSASTSGARRVVIDFDSSFGSCSMKTIRAREGSQETIRSLSPITKHIVEIKSVTIGGETCSIQSGNVFGN